MSTDELILQLQIALDHNTDHLVETILRFGPAEFVSMPASGWSAAQVSEHILTLDQLILKLLKGKAGPAGRPPDEKISTIEAAMSQTARNLKAPDFILPVHHLHDQQTLVTRLIATRKDIHRLIASKPLDHACLESGHPAFGILTRIEWLTFLMAHTLRHLRQYENLWQHLKER